MGFSEFIRERQFLSNVSPSTLEWYKHSFKWLDTDAPTQEDLKAAVLKMRAKGLRATGCNSAIRAINAYAHWASAGSDVKCGSACRHPRIAQMKEPQNVLPTFTDKQIRTLVDWKPKGKDYATNDDSKEKKLLGEVWAKGSNGRALFLMALKKDERGRNVHEQIRGTIEGW